MDVPVVGKYLCCIPLQIGCVLMADCLIGVTSIELFRGVTKILRMIKEEHETGVDLTHNHLVTTFRCILNLGWLIAGILLLFAILKKKMSWMKLITIYLVVTALIWMITGIVHFILQQHIVALIVFIVAFVFLMYFALLIWSYKKNPED